MNSISYLDSVLSRSFAAAPERPSSRASSSAKRSRSHSSLPGSRRASSASPPTPSGSSTLRRWSQEQDDPPRSIYGNALRRTGSTPAGINSSHALTDDSDDDSLNPRPARWSGLWGLTGWLDEAIHPGSRARSRKNSDSQLSLRRTKRVPSLDDLLLSSTAPRPGQARRTASSGSGQPHHGRTDGSSSSSDEARSHSRRKSKRQSRFGHAASLTLTSADQDAPREPWPRSQQPPHAHDDPDLLTEKEREDIVEFDGGDFSPEDLELARQRTISQSSADSSWDHTSSVTHEPHPSPASVATSISASETAQHTHQHQDEQDEKSVDKETLLDAAKGEPAAIQAVADEDPTSTVVDPDAASATPKKETAAAGREDRESEHTPTNNRSTLSPLDIPGADPGTVSASRRSSLRRNPSIKSALDSAASTSTSSLATTDSEELVDRSLTPTKPRRRRSKRGSRSGSTRASESEEPRGWLAPLHGSAGHDGDDAASFKGHAKRSRRGGSAKRAMRRALLALRDLLLAVFLCPVNCVRYLRRRRAVRSEQAVQAIYERAHVPILEKNSGVYEETSRRGARPGSLRFAAKVDSKRDGEKRDAKAVRPRTPKPESDGAGFLEKEPVTEDQAMEMGSGWQALESGPRTPSRLLPNPQAVDPMLAHNSKAALIDAAMAEKEARMEAERQSRIARGRAARRAAAAGAVNGGEAQTTAVMMPSKVPRGPTSSIIHHSPKILVLDLDETLIHSTSRSPSYYAAAGGRTTTSGFLGLETAGAVLGLRANDNPRRIRPHMVEVVLDGRSVLYHVYKRPWADYFLRKVASWYTVVVFTASVQEYADPVIDWLDQGRGLISARLFRESCSFKGGSYVKNLKVVDEDLSKVCLVDNSPASYAINRANGIPIEGWTHDPNDEALLDLLPILDSLRFATDVRHILGIRGW